jgi:hypothetical protein
MIRPLLVFRVQGSLFRFKVVNGYRNQSQSNRLVDRFLLASEVRYRSVQRDAFLAHGALPSAGGSATGLSATDAYGRASDGDARIMHLIGIGCLDHAHTLPTPSTADNAPAAFGAWGSFRYFPDFTRSQIEDL